jgi:divalent metal cation (Fe/Co/Zn/Cd) transporter
VPRLLDVDQALRLEWFTLAWMVIEAGTAIAVGIVAHSLVLEAFGVDSLIELASAMELISRLQIELKRGRAFPHEIERRAARIGGLLLFTLAIYVIVASAWALSIHEGQQTSAVGLILTGVAIPVMYVLARAKLRLAERLR